MDHHENYRDYRDDEKITDNFGNVQNEGYGSGAAIAILMAAGVMLLIWATGSVQVSPYTPTTTTSEAPIAPPPTLPIPPAEPPKT